MTVTVAKFVDEYAALSAFTGVPANEHRADDVADALADQSQARWLAAYRRRALARALLAEDFGVLADRGVPFVTTDADETNVASRTLARGPGAQTTGVDVEMRRAA